MDYLLLPLSQTCLVNWRESPLDGSGLNTTISQRRLVSGLAMGQASLS